MTINLPKLKVQVKSSFVTSNKKEWWLIEGYLVAARCNYGEPILFTIHLQNGALFSGLPIEALSIDSCPVQLIDELTTAELQPWSCLESPVQVIQYDYFKNAEVTINSPKIQEVGEYLFSIDYHGEGLARDPEQHKTHNIIRINSSGRLCAMPNNYLIFKDEFFYDDKLSNQRRLLKRNTVRYKAGG